ncbi:hypothetical protein DEH18_17770 [Streptomyces sp. NHF165]|uniref:tRNA ligase subunit PheS family protein n=1 Tax=Streptomyces TaxID=1883 RepID=UPI00132F1686|nr:MULTISPECIES: hypothetical protein [Streptomyces]QHF95409.1 hypothetical protein DEH18_17770 [Streptomyces sp. NHF165]
MRGAAAAADLSDPGLPPAGPRIGRPHPVAALVERITACFVPLGFDVTNLPLLATEDDNFDLLGYPPGHPTRTRLTFHPAPGVVLRTQASSGIAEVLRQARPGPARALLVATCFRNEPPAPHSGPQFTQIDGVVAQPGLALPDLMGLFDVFVRGVFGAGCAWQLTRCDYPFVDPGFALSIACPHCGSGCATCWDRGRVEVCTGGVLRDEVLTASGYAPGRTTGLSFGCSVERLLRYLHGLHDMRELLANDPRVLEQFEGQGH